MLWRWAPAIVCGLALVDPCSSHFTQSNTDIHWLLDSTGVGTSMLNNFTAGVLTGLSPNTVGSMSRNNMAYSEELLGNLSSKRRGYSFVLARDASYVSTCTGPDPCPISSARVNDAVVGLCRAGFNLATRQSEFPYRNFPNTAGAVGDDLLLYGFRFYPTVNRITIVNNGSNDPTVRYCEPAEAQCVTAPTIPLAVHAFDKFTMRISPRNTLEFLMNETLLVETAVLDSQALRPCAFLKGTATLLTRNQWVEFDNFGSLRWASIDSSIASLHAADAQLLSNITSTQASLAAFASQTSAEQAVQDTARAALAQATSANFSAATSALLALRIESILNDTAQSAEIATLHSTDAALSRADTALGARITVASGITSTLRENTATNHSNLVAALAAETARATTSEISLAVALQNASSTLRAHTDTLVSNLTANVDSTTSTLRAALIGNVSSVIVQTAQADSIAATDRSLIRNQTTQQIAAVNVTMAQSVLALTSMINAGVGSVNASVVAHNSTRIAEASEIRSMVLQTEGNLSATIELVNTTLVDSHELFEANTTAELSSLRAEITALSSRLDVALAAISANFSSGRADVANVAQGLAATNDATANNAETSDLYTAVAIGAVVAILLAVLISVMLAKRRPSQDDLPVRKSHRELAGAPEASGRTGGPVLNNPMYNPSATKNYIDVSPESPESEMATSVSGYAPVSYKSAGSSDYDERSRVADYTAQTHYNEPKPEAESSFRRVNYRAEGGSVRPSSIFRENPLTEADVDEHHDGEEYDEEEEDADSKSAAPSGFGSEVTSFPC
eukprot:m.48342 g.48342  ORF g.48342 m.48342 type:complete len:798 (-) comp8911_c0_seq2:975-3368(-)